MTESRRIGLVEAVERLFGFELWDSQRRLLQSVDECPRQVWAIGRRGTKSTMAALTSLWALLCRPDMDAMVRPGETRYAVVIATNLRQARLVVAAARSIVDTSPTLSALLVSPTSADELHFRLPSGARVALAAFPCSSRGGRGWPVSCFIMDEAAFFVSDTDGPAVARGVWSALRPATAQFGDQAVVIVSSSPMGEGNFFADMFRRAESGEMPGWVTHQIPSAEMNPTLGQDELDRLRAESPESFPSEYEAQFEAGFDLLFDRSRFEPVEGWEPARADEGISWTAGMDPAFSADSYGLALVARAAPHPDRFALGPVKALRPERVKGGSFEQRRQAEDRVLAQVAAECHEYAANAVLDQHQSRAIVARLAEHGVTARVLAMTGGPTGTKWAVWRELRDRVHDGSVPIPADPELLRELMSVRYKIEAGGPKVVLPRTAAGHCDRAQALAVGVYEKRWKQQPRRHGASAPAVRPITADLPSEVGVSLTRRRDPDRAGLGGSSFNLDDV